MKLEPGKHYRMRNGGEMRVYADDAWGAYPIHGAVYVAPYWSVYGWTIDGQFIFMSRLQHGHDIISEMPEAEWTK